MKFILTMGLVISFSLSCYAYCFPGFYWVGNPIPTTPETQPLSVNNYHFSDVDALIKEHFALDDPNDEMDDIYRKTEEYYGNPKVLEAKRYINALNNSNLINLFTGNELTKLPVGVKKSFNGYTYSIVFAEAKIYPDYAEMKVYGSIQKDGEADLVFGADDIKFSYEGGIIGDSKLALFSDYPLAREGKKIAFVFNRFQEQVSGNHKGCYITFDCNGFAEARIEGEMHISRDWILPTTKEGQVIPGFQRVTTELAATVTDLNDFVVEVSMPHFTLSKDTSITILVDNAIVDFSDTKNGVNFTPPPVFDPESGFVDYNIDPETTDLWKGIFFENIEIVLPDVFDQDGGKSLTLGASNLYIDGGGVTGKFYVDNPLPIEEGQLGNSGWAFGIERVDIDLIYSQIYGFGFEGLINVPINEESAALSYVASANLATETYIFNMGVDSIMKIPMWEASKVELKPGTRINIEVVERQFRAQAVLCGSMNISMSGNEENQNTNLNIADIDFDKLLVDTRAPFVSLAENGGHISFTSGPVLNNSILNLDHASLTNIGNDRVMFTMGMEASVMSEGDGGAKTGGTFGMVGKMNSVNNRLKWDFEEMKLIALEVHLDFAKAGYIRGGISFFADDPVYGNGFYGYLDGGILKEGNGYKFNMVASARFGTKFSETEDEYKYWNFDVYVSSSTMAITIYPPIAANGFGGGIYHHMRMAGYDLDAMAEGGPSNPYSGLVYEPDPNIGLGLKATIGLTTTSGKAFQGVVTLELVFTDELALAEILMYGTGEISGSNEQDWEDKGKDNIADNVKSTELAQSDNASSAQSGKANTITCAAFLRISLQGGFEMHGSFKAFLDAAEGKLTGEGMVDFLVSDRTKKWHLYVGGYSDNSISNLEGVIIPPVNVNIAFQSFEIGAELYLLMGNDLPGPPPIDAEAAAFFGIPTNTNNRDDMNTGGRSAEMGTAAAFGASAYLDFRYTRDEHRFIDVLGGTGFDLCLLSNADLSRCSESGTNPQGQKGWRSLGNLYAFASIEGQWRKAWIDWKIPKQKIGILIVGDVPNPDYFNVKLKAQIFNWLNVNKEVELGEKCGEVVN